MNEIFFLVFAFLSVFFSIKLSYYADLLSRSGLVSRAFVGGIVLAGVTALPEFVTCFSSVFLGNLSLAMGDVLGSNLFNFFMICVFDIVFIKKMLFCNISSSHNVTLVLLIICYLFLFVFSSFFSFNLLFIGVPSLVIFFVYIFYVLFVTSRNSCFINDSFVDTKFLVLKLVITSICMVLSSLILTVIVNNLSFIYPSFSSSFLGAIFLGVTTSLPEVVTFYTLVSVGNYDLAFSNIFGSNMFNLLVLGFADVISGGSIYSFVDKSSLLIILLGFVFSCICLFVNSRKSYCFGIRYICFSLLVVLLYLGFWMVNFVI